tara:strand:- start:92 stop:397 length:306 start_codon:yes stop_codon:yes gene_type:complete
MLDARDNLISLISDLHKDARGFRPRGMFNWDAMSIADLEDLADCMGHELEAIIVAEREEAAMLDRMWRDDVAMGIIEPDDTVELEAWEVWEGRAESAGFGA